MFLQIIKLIAAAALAASGAVIIPGPSIIVAMETLWICTAGFVAGFGATKMAHSLEQGNCLGNRNCRSSDVRDA